MKTVARLAIPILLGLVAGALNWWVIRGQVAPHTFTKVAREIRAGQVIDEASLKPLAVSGDLDAIGQSAVPFKDRAVLFNRRAGRDLLAGDLVLWRDATAPPPTAMLAAEGEELLPISLDGISIVPRLLQVGDQVGFLISPGRGGPAAGAPKAGAGELELEHIGPYRVLSVGDRLGRIPDGPARGGSGDERVITVAIRRGKAGGRFLDADSQRLVEAMDAMHSRRDSGRRVVSVLLKPTTAVRVAEGGP